MDSAVQLPKFSKAFEKEEFNRWKTLMNSYFVVREITTDEAKVACVNLAGGDELLDLLESIAEPTTELINSTFTVATDRNEYNKLMLKLSTYFSKIENSVQANWELRNLKQMRGEKIRDFEIRIRSQARKCGHSGESLEKEVMTQILSGTHDGEIVGKAMETKFSCTAEIVKFGEIREAVRSTKRNYEDVHAVASTSKTNQSQQNRSGSYKTNKELSCFNCGSKEHLIRNCPDKSRKCFKCGQSGHERYRCPENVNVTRTESFKRNNEDTHVISLKKFKEDSERKKTSETPDSAEMVNLVGGGKPIQATIGGVNVLLNVDTGTHSNIGSKGWELMALKDAKVWKMEENPQKKFVTYGAEKTMNPVYSFLAKIGIGEKEETAKFYVVDVDAPNLLGSETAEKLHVISFNNVDGIFHFPLIRDVQAEIRLRQEAIPRCQVTRKIPLAYREPMQAKLKELEEKDIIEKCDTASGWSNPLLVVPKRGSTDVRLCVDLRFVNKFIEDQPCVLTNLDELTAFAEGAKVFSTIDLPDAFHLIELEEESRKVTTFSTPLGCFRYKRLCFGLKNAPMVFMKIMRYILEGCPGTKDYMDDILVVGKDVREHDENLSKVLKRLDEYNVPIKVEKCKLRQPEVDFIGHVFNNSGIAPSPKKVEALRTCLAPASKQEVHSFLGMLSYVAHRWIPDLADLTHPLRRLTHKGAHFIWEETQQVAFKTIMEKLENLVTLGYFSVTEETQLFADASPYGLGAVLIQINEAKEVRRVAFASKSLAKEDKSLSQTEREALACVWAIENFDFFLRGGHFVLNTDHKPLEIIFGIRKPTSSLTSARIERWLLRVQEYNFSVKYVPGGMMVADFLSRQLSKERDGEGLCTKEDKEFVNIVMEDALGSITQEQLQEASKKDDVLSGVRRGLVSGVWGDDLKVYQTMESEMTVIGNIVLRGERVIIPKDLVGAVLNIAHEGHVGMSLMKRRLRERYYWFKMDKDIEKYVGSCDACKLVANSLPAEPLVRSELPDYAWQKLAIDFMGPAPSGEKVMVLVDYFSRYFEVKYLSKTTAEKVIECLKEIFGRLDWPEELTSDNGPPFNSIEFKTFCGNHGIRLRHSLPYQPRMNGEVEIQNKLLAKIITISVNTGLNWKEEVRKVTETHRVTPHTVTGKSPLELMFNRNRKVRGKLHAVHNLTRKDAETDIEWIRNRDKNEKEKGKVYADRKYGYKVSDVKEGDYVLTKNVKRKWKWEAKNDPQRFKVLKKQGAAVTVVDDTGREITKAVNQLVKVNPPSQEEAQRETWEVGGYVPDLEPAEQQINPETTEASEMAPTLVVTDKETRGPSSTLAVTDKETTKGVGTTSFRPTGTSTPCSAASLGIQDKVATENVIPSRTMEDIRSDLEEAVETEKTSAAKEQATTRPNRVTRRPVWMADFM